MMRTCIVVGLAIAAACRSTERTPAPATKGSGSGSSAAASAAGSGSAAATIDPAMHDFCVRSMEQIKKCFEDDAFWDAHATTFFAAQKQPIDPEAKQRWIGVYKDSFVSLVRNKELAKNCDVMLAQNQLPTAKQMELVDHAREQSCAAFGGALGYVIYGEGAFFKPRDGMVPSELSLSPQP